MTTIIITGISCLCVGALLAAIILRFSNIMKSNNMLDEAKKEADSIKKEKILQAKEKFIEIQEAYEAIEREKKQ